MNNQLQILTSSNGRPSLPTAESIATIRLDEKRYPRYRTLPHASRLEWLASEIKALAELSRLKEFNGKEAVLAAAVLDEMLMQTEAMADLTFPELHEAFRGGVFGIYGEYYGLTAPSLYGFVDRYLDSEKKMEASKIVQKTKAEILIEKRRAEREAEQRKIREEIEQAKKDGTFVPTGRGWWNPKKEDEA